MLPTHHSSHSTITTLALFIHPLTPRVKKTDNIPDIALLEIRNLLKERNAIKLSELASQTLLHIEYFHAFTKLMPMTMLKMAALNYQFANFLFNTNHKIFLQRCYDFLATQSGNTKEFQTYFSGKTIIEQADNFEKITGIKLWHIFLPFSKKNYPRAFKEIFNKAYFTLKQEVGQKLIHIGEYLTNDKTQIFYETSLTSLAYFNVDLKVLPKNISTLTDLKNIMIKGRLLFILPELKHIKFSD